MEKWLSEHGESYLVTGGGYYHWEVVFCNGDNECHHVYSKRPYDWIDHGYFTSGRYNVSTFRRAARLIIPNALRFSAGFLHKFLREAGI